MTDPKSPDAEASLLAQYAASMKTANAMRAIEIEMDNGLYGYAPEIVSVALKAIDEGRDPDDAITAYLDGTEEEDHTA